MITFPCPKSTQTMKPVEGGFHCGYCNKKVYDLGKLSSDKQRVWKSKNPTSCISVVTNRGGESTNRFSISKFALVLLLVGGTLFFNNLSAQVVNTIKNVHKELDSTDQNTCGLLKVDLFNSKEKRVYGSVWIVLPNGKELEMLERSGGGYKVDIPHYCRGKELTIFAEYAGKVQERTVVMFMPEGLSEEFFFKSRKYRHYHYRTSGF